jgi:micrococcal nuclease
LSSTWAKRFAALLLSVLALAACEPGAVDLPATTDAAGCRIERVYDGDTITVSCLDANVRLLLIDAPEVESGTSPAGCYGVEARDYLRSRLTRGTPVTLEAGVVDRDRYGRYLRYVWLGDELVNETLVRDGFAVRYTAAEDTRHRDRIAAAERAARASGLGLWSACPSAGS